MGEHGELDTLRGLRLGSCVLGEPLGFGGMGAVYLARQERPHRQVAVKVLRPQARVDPEAWRVFLARFRLEADATAALDHANIVPIYEFGEAGDLAYLVMPYLHGGSLASLIANEGPLPVARAIDYCGQIAAALDYAHEHGVIHRDVKPSNLLRHPDGRLLLADFGIARLTGHGDADGEDARIAKLPEYTWDGGLTQTGSAMGTPEYMAPEQVRGNAAGAAADIYSLGIVTYVMLAATSPFAGGDINAVLRRQLVEPPMPLRPLRPDVTPRVEEAVFWALAKDAEDRPRTAGEFARALLSASRSRTLGGLPSWRSQVAGRQSAAATQTPPKTASVRPRSLLQGTVPLRTPDSSRLDAGVSSVRSASAHGGYPLPPDDATIASVSAPPPRLLPGGPTGPNDPGGPGGTPLWPVDPDRRSRPAKTSSATKRASIMAIGAACVALVLAAVLVLTALGNAGLGFGSPSAGGSAHPIAHATATPTVTPEPTATATSFPTNWLSVSPASISLTCSKRGSSKTVRLTNSGPSDVQWQAQISPSSFLPPIKVSPSSGKVPDGGSISIVITNQSWLEAKGTIEFVPQDSDAGNAPTVYFDTCTSYTGG